ncbi:hypothetical protein M9H77_30719 [Catharanthus roseus]|uniref:Uncharacterized protein n=1 Tax=Catharanthus roseus TaxID=4058 RepID=A0ACB9ZY31_CATRO|nr:hypothetical protein M9H77_30719 [Catharanthus roseus]
MEAVGKKAAPTGHGKVTYHRQFSFLDSRIEDLIQDFDLRLDDSRDDLRRYSGFNFNYSQVCLELKKEGQSRIPPTQTLRYDCALLGFLNQQILSRS